MMLVIQFYDMMNGWETRHSRHDKKADMKQGQAQTT